jgi:hypothetical protein
MWYDIGALPQFGGGRFGRSACPLGRRIVSA